jgi:hypothetical protein
MFFVFYIYLTLSTIQTLGVYVSAVAHPHHKVSSLSPFMLNKLNMVCYKSSTYEPLLAAEFNAQAACVLLHLICTCNL